MSANKITLDFSDRMLTAIDDWRSKRHPSPTREAAILAILDEWAREKTGPTKHISDEGTRPEELNASNDD